MLSFRNFLIEKYQESEENVRKAHKKLEPDLQSSLEGLNDTVRSTLRKRHNAVYKSGLKPADSVVDKVVKRGKPLSGMTDLVRGAVLFDTHEEANDFVNRLKRKHKDKILRHEEKERGGDPTLGYYGTHHFDIQHNGITNELQVTTKRLWKAKEAAHKIYTKTRSRPGGPTEMEKAESKRMFTLANRPRYRKLEEETNEEMIIEEKLMRSFTDEELEDFHPDSYKDVDVTKYMKK
jgi:hypothetical protein